MTPPIMYLLDNNALIQIGYRRRRSRFFKERCRIPEDVLFEFETDGEQGILESLKAPVTPGVIEELVRVMALLPLEENRVIDLYQNQGGADPVLVATGVHLNSVETMIPIQWDIVTADLAVRQLAEDLGVHVHSTADLISMIDTYPTRS